MKKILRLLVIIMFIFVFSGCEVGGGNGTNGPSLNQKAEIKVDKEKEIKVGEEYQIVYTLNIISGNVSFESSNKKIASVDEEGKVLGISEGKATITLSCVYKEKTYESQIEIIVVNDDEHICDNKYAYNETHHWIDCDICGNVEEEHEFDVSSNVSEDGTIIYNVFKCQCGYEYTEEESLVPSSDKEAPLFKKKDNYQDVYELNWGKTFDAFSDLDVIDNIDGNINKNVEVVTELDNKKYGEYTVTYKAKDQAGNESVLERTVKVVWNYGVQFIGHAGSYYGLMNSEEAILYAIQVLNYQCVEVDIKQTSDGVFVLCHDDTFGDYTLASTPWSTLKDYEVTKSRKAGIPAQNGSVTKDKYTAKLCTLERFLEICKEYNVRPVLELKYSKGIASNDQSRMQALMDLVEKYDLIDQTILLGSQYQCLIWARNNGYDTVTCQYLVNSLESETYLQRCKDYNFDISINVTANYSNTDAWIFRYQSEGIKISTYTFTQYVDYDVVQKWINLGVDYVTCDWQLMDKLNLEPTPVEKVTVTFKDYDGTIIEETLVSIGGDVSAPYAPTRPGYKFIGWDKEAKKVQEDLVITALYEEIPNSIIYIYEKGKLNATMCTSLEEMITLFWNELYAWSESTKPFETFKSEALAKWKAGNEYSEALVYKAGQKNQIVEGYFVSCSENYDQWMPWMNAFDEQVTAINNAQSAWGGTYVGYLRLYALLEQTASYWTDDKEMALYTKAGVKDILPISYAVGTIVVLPELVDPSGSTFLGWYDEQGNKVTQVGDKALGSIILTAKWSE